MMKKMATTTPRRGEVWLVDLGMVAKIRPCLVVSIPANDENDRVLTIPTIKMIRMLGNLTAEEMLEIEAGLKVWLGLTD